MNLKRIIRDFGRVSIKCTKLDPKQMAFHNYGEFRFRLIRMTVIFAWLTSMISKESNSEFFRDGCK